jgi:hypothetical protein
LITVSRYCEKGIAYGISSLREGGTFSQELEPDPISHTADSSLAGSALPRVCRGLDGVETGLQHGFGRGATSTDSPGACSPCPLGRGDPGEASFWVARRRRRLKLLCSWTGRGWPAGARPCQRTYPSACGARVPGCAELVWRGHATYSGLGISLQMFLSGLAGVPLSHVSLSCKGSERFLR